MPYTVDDLYRALAMSFIGTSAKRSTIDSWIIEAKEDERITIKLDQNGAASLTLPVSWAPETISKAKKAVEKMTRLGAHVDKV